MSFPILSHLCLSTTKHYYQAMSYSTDFCNGPANEGKRNLLVQATMFL